MKYVELMHALFVFRSKIEKMKSGKTLPAQRKELDDAVSSLIDRLQREKVDNEEPADVLKFDFEKVIK